MTKPTLAFRTLHNVATRWDPDLAVALTSALAPDRIASLQLLSLDQANPALDPKSQPVFRLASGTLVAIQRTMRDKVDSVVLEAMGSDGKGYVVKIAKTDSGKSRLAQQVSFLDALSRGPIPVARVIEHGETYLVLERLPGPTGAEWLQKAAEGSPAPAEAIALKELFASLVDEGHFVSGLWPSHAVLTHGRWALVNAHGLSAEADPAKLREKLASRFADRWAEKLSPPCARALLETVFPPTPR